MNRKTLTFAIIMLLSLVGLCYQLMRPTPLDFSNDEAPFRQMKMPPKLVRAYSYMDGGSVSVEILDQTDHQYFITFPIDYKGIRTSHPTAREGRINDYANPLLKNPARAKAICVQLLKDHAIPYTFPGVDVDDLNQAPLRALSNPPQQTAYRICKKVADLFD